MNSVADTNDVAAGNGTCATAQGVCTLRAAIQESNVLPGVDTVEFAIGSGVRTIMFGSPMPPITNPVVIDGTTQPGFAGSPLIVLDGRSSDGRNNGGGLTVSAGNSTLRGLAIINFYGAGVVFRGGGGNVLEGSFIGIDHTGTTARGNWTGGVLIDGSPNNRIGGTSAAQRNVISANLGAANTGGIMLDGGGGNTIQGNFIGTDATGILDRGNDGRGIAASGSSDNVIGGPMPGAGNLISGNWATGVRLRDGSNRNLVQGNTIGPNRTVTAFLKNDRGVQIKTSGDNLVVGNLIAGHVYDGVLLWGLAMNNTILANVIAFNGLGPIDNPLEADFNGVLILDISVGNRLLGNSIFGNVGGGIDLEYTGSNPNDPGDGDTGANSRQNFPVLTSVAVSGGTTTIMGTLNSAASTTFLIELFANPSCYLSGFGEGALPIGLASTTTDGAGNAGFTYQLPTALAVGWSVTGTATDPGGNTSEFSRCVRVR